MKKDPDPIDIHIAGRDDEKFAKLITEENAGRTCWIFSMPGSM